VTSPLGPIPSVTQRGGVNTEGSTPAHTKHEDNAVHTVILIFADHELNREDLGLINIARRLSERAATNHGNEILERSLEIHPLQHTSAYVSIRQHTSAYVSIRQHTSAYVSIRQHTSAYVSIPTLPAFNSEIAKSGE
jgi:hypothetical protein